LNKAILLILLLSVCLNPGIAKARTPQDRSQPISKPILKAPNQDIAGQFDFYVLALSWSPNYCATNGSRDPQQCGTGRQLGFVLHGLWPQFDRGWPANCTREPLDRQIQRQFPDLYPNEKLYSHEWSKHGTCSGLSQTQFHQLAADLKAGLKIPARYDRPTQPLRTTISALKQEFVTANPTLTVDRIAPFCSGSGRLLQEVRICEPKAGKLQSCSASILTSSRKSCGQPDFLIRSVR
jgi:ribonuclease T2